MYSFCLENRIAPNSSLLDFGFSRVMSRKELPTNDEVARRLAGLPRKQTLRKNIQYLFRRTSVLFVLQDELNVLKIGIKDEMDQFPSLITNVKDLKRKKELENLMSVYDEGTVVEIRNLFFISERHCNFCCFIPLNL